MKNLVKKSHVSVDNDVLVQTETEKRKHINIKGLSQNSFAEKTLNSNGDSEEEDDNDIYI